MKKHSPLQLMAFRSLPIMGTWLMQVLLCSLLFTSCSSSEPVPPVFDQAEDMYDEFEKLVPSATVKLNGEVLKEDEIEVKQLEVVFKNGPRLERDMMRYCGLAYELAKQTRSHLKDPHQYDRIIVVLLNVEGVGHEFITRYEYEYTSDYLDSMEGNHMI